MTSTNKSVVQPNIFGFGGDRIVEPVGTEPKDRFLKRCMADAKLKKQIPDDAERMASCRTFWTATPAPSGLSDAKGMVAGLGEAERNVLVHDIGGRISPPPGDGAPAPSPAAGTPFPGTEEDLAKAITSIRQALEFMAESTGMKATDLAKSDLFDRVRESYGETAIP